MNECVACGIANDKINHNIAAINDNNNNKTKRKEEEEGYTYGNRVVYIPYWSEYGPGLGVFVFTFEPEVVVELVWCGVPCKTRIYQ